MKLLRRCGRQRRMWYLMNKKWIPLNTPMGNESKGCKLDHFCKPLQDIALERGIYKFRCPLLVEVDEDVEFGECDIIPECQCVRSEG